jgi:hypothetical protein
MNPGNVVPKSSVYWIDALFKAVAMRRKNLGTLPISGSLFGSFGSLTFFSFFFLFLPVAVLSAGLDGLLFFGFSFASSLVLSSDLGFLPVSLPTVFLVCFSSCFFGVVEATALKNLDLL